MLIVLGILVNENEMDSILSTYHIKGIDKLGLSWAKLRSNWDLASLQLRSVGVCLIVMVG